MLSHRKGVLLDGIGSELVRSSAGGRRKTLSAWLGGAGDMTVTATDSSTARTLAARTAEIRRAEDWGAVGDGATDDATAIQALLTAGYIWAPVSGRSYAIGTRLNITSAGSGIIGDDTPLIVMLSGSGKFANTSASAGDRYGTNAVGIYASSIARPIVKGVRIKYETQTDDRYVKAIAFQTCTDILIEEVEAWNFTKALGVIYVGACTGGSVSRNYVHDCTTNSATTGQITGIEFDNDNTLSSGIDVDGNRIENLTVGASFLASWGYQTDGINVTKETSKQLRIRGNHIKGVGEGIDHFGVDCEITDNHIEDCYYYGIKHVNGSCRTLTTTNTIRRCGLAGIILAGSATINQDTADNYIFGNDIYDIDPNGTFSGNTTACILFAANSGTTYLPRRNHVCDNKLDCGTNGKYGVYAGASDGTLNFVLRNRVRNAVTADYSIHATCVPYFYTETLGNIATSGTIDPAQGADIASATTTDIGAATGNYAHITGTTTITGLGTVAAGIRRTVKFTSALILTHNGTSLILPGAANITTAANDTAEFVSLGSGNWVCLWYKPQVAPVYSEGTWTPALTFATPGDLAVGYTTQVGTYVRVGNLVTANVTLVLSSFTFTTASGSLRINGLPLTPKNVSGQQWHGTAHFEGVTKVGYTNFTTKLDANSTILGVRASGSGVGASSVAAADMPTGGNVRLFGTITYQV